MEKRSAVKPRSPLLIGLLGEKGKVIAHHHVGEDAKAKEALELAHQSDKMLFLGVTEDETAVDDSGYAVVVAQAFAFDARLTHGA